jgi:hypothetical protein|tara:strand:+ start:699 stop:971 length:273 start_codon:yes stop_codon:yes gene_type:complete
MYTDYKTPRCTQNDDRSWVVEYVTYEGDYTKDRFDSDGNLLRGKDYERYRVIDRVALRFPPMSEAQVRLELNKRLRRSRTRTPISEQRRA